MITYKNIKLAEGDKYKCNYCDASLTNAIAVDVDDNHGAPSNLLILCKDCANYHKERVLEHLKSFQEEV